MNKPKEKEKKDVIIEVIESQETALQQLKNELRDIARITSNRTVNQDACDEQVLLKIQTEGLIGTGFRRASLTKIQEN